MSQQRNVIIRVLGSFLSRHRRLVTGAIGALGVSGLVVGGLAGPAAATGLPSNVVLQQWTDVNLGWVAGDLGVNGANASAYKESETVPFRLDVTTAGAGTFNFSVCRDYMNGAVRGYLSLEPYTTSRLPVIDALATVTDPASGSAQPFTGAAVVGSVHIDSVHEVGGAGACGTNQRETQVQITIGAGPLGAAPVGAYVLWGGRLASPSDSGVGPAHGASHFPGGSLSMQLLSPAKNRSIKTDAIIQLATINVQKVVDSGTATADQFCFNISPNPVGVALPACPAAGQDTVAFVGLPTGSYTVTEAGLTGYSFASGLGSTANCAITSGVATAGVAVGNTPTDATCVFHNRRQTGTLTINDVLAPSSDPGLFNLQIDGSTAGTGADVGDAGTTGAITVSSGSHDVGAAGGTGTNIADYTATVSCSASSGPVVVTGGSVSVADGENVVCTVTLTPNPVVTTTTSTTSTTTSTTTTTVPDPVVIDPTTSSTTTSTTTTTVPDPVVVDPTTSSTTTSTTTTTVPDPVVVDPTTSSTTTTTTTTVPDPVDPTSTTTTTVQDPIVIVDPLPTTSSTTSTSSTSTTTTTAPKHRQQPGDDDGSGVDTSDVDPGLPTTTTTTAAPAVDPGTTVAGGGLVAQPAPEQILGAVVERPAPAPDAPAEAAPAPAGGLLPRTGAGVGDEAGLAVALLAAGLAALGVARRRRPSEEG